MIIFEKDTSKTPLGACAARGANILFQIMNFIH
jgi:hypothetical protein